MNKVYKFDITGTVILKDIPVTNRWAGLITYLERFKADYNPNYRRPLGVEYKIVYTTPVAENESTLQVPASLFFFLPEPLYIDHTSVRQKKHLTYFSRSALPKVWLVGFVLTILNHLGSKLTTSTGKLINKLLYAISVLFAKSLKVFNVSFLFRRKKNKPRTVLISELRVKLLQLQLEKAIFSVFELRARVHVKNVFTVFGEKYTKSKLPRYIHQFKQLTRLFFYNDFINIFFFAVTFKDSSLVSKFISSNIRDEKKHYHFLRKVKRLIIKFYRVAKFSGIHGLFIGVRGKFQGVLRKRRFKMTLGKFGVGTFNSFISYSLRKSYTRYGVFSIKVALYFCVYKLGYKLYGIKKKPNSLSGKK